MKRKKYQSLRIILTVFIFVICFIPVISHAKSTPEAPKVKCLIETDRAILPAGDPQNAVIKITLEAPPPPSGIKRPPVNLSIVLDRSGSMSGSKIEKAKDAAIEALKRLGSQDIFSLVVYDHVVDTIIPAQRVLNTDRMIRKINNITNLLNNIYSSIL